MLCFTAQLIDYSWADWHGLRDHLREVLWKDIFKFNACTTASELCEWVQVEIDVYITHHKYQVKLLSSPQFSAEQKSFLHLYQQNKSSESKVKFKQASNRCKMVLEAVKLAYATKTKQLSIPRNLALGTLGELLIVFSKKVNLLYLLYSVDRRCCLLHFIRQNCLLKTFLRTLIWMTLLFLDLYSLLELI